MSKVTATDAAAYAQLGAVLVQLGLITEQAIVKVINDLKGEGGDVENEAKDNATAADTDATLKRILAATA